MTRKNLPTTAATHPHGFRPLSFVSASAEEDSWLPSTTAAIPPQSQTAGSRRKTKGYGTLRVYVDGYQSDRSGQIYITLSDNTRATVSVVQSSKYGEYPEPPVKPDDPDTPDNPDKPDNPGTTTIAAPKNVKAGFDYINDKPYTWVSWDKSYSKSYTYKVYRSTSANGSFSVIATTSDGSISDNNVSGGRTYYYKVKAFDSNGNPAQSNSQ